jgi:maltose O-acetyltransferase
VGKDGTEVVTKSEKVKRGVFWTLYYLLARHLPRSYVRYSMGARAIRAFILKRLFKSFGKNVNIEPKVIFFNMSESEIGDNSGIGMCSYIGTMKIGRDVMIGEELMAISRNHEFVSTEIPMRLQGFQKDRPITIEDDVWIGARVTILPGIIVGKGSIIGAGSVVTKAVPPDTVVAGNPAKIIRKR